MFNVYALSERRHYHAQRLRPVQRLGAAGAFNVSAHQHHLQVYTFPHLPKKLCHVLNATTTSTPPTSHGIYGVGIVLTREELAQNMLLGVR